MKAFFYSKETGLFTGATFTGASNLLERALPPDCSAFIADTVDVFNSRIDIATGQIVDYQAPSLTDDHRLNVGSKRWELEAMAVRRQQTLAATYTELLAEQRATFRANQE